jgi:uncharacterized protein (DUF362 family)
MKMGFTNRRDFLKRGMTGALFLGGVRSAGASAPPGTPVPGEKSRVVISRDSKLREAGSGVDSARLQKLLDRAIQSLYGFDSPLEAWKKVVRPGEVVGLKASCLAGRGISTSVPLVEAICECLQQAGVREIVIWDRLNSDLESARFKIRERGQGIRCFGNDALGYEEDLAVYGNAASRMSRTLTQVCDAVINLPVLKDHSITGVTIALKSMFGAIHNPNKYHDNGCDPFVADVCAYAHIRRRLRLVVCDAMRPQCQGGPPSRGQYQWPYGGILIGTDPVAVDRVGLEILERKRAASGLKPLEADGRPVRYLKSAAERGLGVANLANIEIVSIGKEYQAI